MLKKVIFLLVMSFLSCSKQQNKAKKENVLNPSQEVINLKNYSFNTVNQSTSKIALAKEFRYVLDFWYLECAPCVKQHKKIQEYQKELLKNNIQIVGISIDKSQENWRSYLQGHQYNWENYNQFGGTPNLKEDLGIKFFPSYFLVDSDGNIEKKFNSFQKVLTYLNL